MGLFRLSGKIRTLDQHSGRMQKFGFTGGRHSGMSGCSGQADARRSWHPFPTSSSGRRGFTGVHPFIRSPPPAKRSWPEVGT